MFWSCRELSEKQNGKRSNVRQREHPCLTTAYCTVPYTIVSAKEKDDGEDNDNHAIANESNKLSL